MPAAPDSTYAAVPPPVTDGWQALLPGSGYVWDFFSAPFFVLLALLAALCQLSAHRPPVRRWALLAISLYLYTHWVGWAVLQLVALATLHWWVGHRLGRLPDGHPARRWLLALAVAAALGSLLFYKYTGFLLSTWWGLLGAPGTEPVWNLLVPLGISFYTLKSLGYVLTRARDLWDHPEPRWDEYLTYVSLFTNLQAGPISRAEQVLPQLRTATPLTPALRALALGWLASAFIKKWLLADPLAQNFIDRVFAAPGSYSALENLLAAAAYGFQLFLDFSAYTELMLACSLMLGLQLAPNFHEPFKAQTVSDFWRRWHISLSQWFNDFVFRPLALQWRGWGRTGTVLAVVVTFMLSGLWHGAGWGYVLWGLAHGLAIGYEVLSQPWRRRWAQRLPRWLYAPLSVLLLYAFLTFTYPLFRGGSWPVITAWYARVAQGPEWHLLGQWLQAYAWVAAALAAALVLHYWPSHGKKWLWLRWQALPWWAQGLALAAAVWLAFQGRSAQALPFFYLRF